MKLFCLSLLVLATSIPAMAADWPQWRGPARDGHAGPGETFPDRLPAELKAAWKIEVGPGHSSPVAAGGKVFYLDAQEDKEVAHAVDAATGRELWRTPFAAMVQDEWGAGPRSTPFVDGTRVFVQSCDGEFCALDAATGRELWRASFEKDFGVKFLGSKANEGTARRRGNNGSGLVDGAHVLVPVGGPNGATVVCFDKENGKVIWKGGGDEAAYSSLMVADLAGGRQVVAFTAEGLLGLGRADGKPLWNIPLVTNAKRHAATPVIIGDHIVVNSHTLGLLDFNVVRRGDVIEAAPVWKNTELKINLATPVAVNGFLYGHGPSKNFICADTLTGETKWTQPGFGDQYSATIFVGGKLVTLTDTGTLVVMKPSPAACEEIARIQVCGKNWNHPAWASGRLFIRDARTLASYPLSEMLF